MALVSDDAARCAPGSRGVGAVLSGFSRCRAREAQTQIGRRRIERSCFIAFPRALPAAGRRSRVAAVARSAARTWRVGCEVRTRPASAAEAEERWPTLGRNPPFAGNAVLRVQAVPVARLPCPGGGRADHLGSGAVGRGDIMLERRRHWPRTRGKHPHERAGEAGREEQPPPFPTPEAAAARSPVGAMPHASEPALQAERRFACLFGVPTVADAPSPGGGLHAGLSRSPGA